MVEEYEINQKKFKNTLKQREMHLFLKVEDYKALFRAEK